MIDLIRLSRGQDIGISGISNLSENRARHAAAPGFHRLNDLIGINLAVGVDRAPKDRSHRLSMADPALHRSAGAPKHVAIGLEKYVSIKRTAERAVGVDRIPFDPGQVIKTR